MKTIIIIFAILAIVVISLFLLSICPIVRDLEKDLDTGNDHEFPDAGNDSFRFNNFSIFKRIVYCFAEKDEEIKNYLLSRKNKHASHATNIPNSNVDGKADSKDIPSDI
jgi:hypothetical protein